MRPKNSAMFNLIVVLSAFFLSSCTFSKPGTKSEPAATVSEGTDTPITVTGYKDFHHEPFRFPEKGDKVAVISPASLPSEEKYNAIMDGFRDWGYDPVAGKVACVDERTLEDCVADLEWALEDPEITAVFCVRGGYGSSEVMDRIPLSLIEQAKKPFIGFSDNTVLLSAWTKAGIPSIHASTAQVFLDFPEACLDVERRILGGEVPSYRCEGSEYDLPGTAQGILIGGNLSTFTAVLDTAYDCTVLDEPYILFLEDVGEDMEHIHRLLTILDHRGVFDRAAGIVFGEWTEYPEECPSYSGSSRGGRFQSVSDMISRQFLPGRNIPVAFGFPAGHGDTNYPLLMGTEVKLEVKEDSFSLEWLDPSAAQ